MVGVGAVLNASLNMCTPLNLEGVGKEIDKWGVVLAFPGYHCSVHDSVP